MVLSPIILNPARNKLLNIFRDKTSKDKPFLNIYIWEKNNKIKIQREMTFSLYTPEVG